MRGANEYARALGPFFKATPKFVFAAIAVSFAARIFGASPDHVAHRLLDEWETLFKNGIVKQPAPGARFRAHLPRS